MVKMNKLRWYGHVMRREDDYIIKVALGMKMTGKRSRGRPNSRWINNTGGHLEEKNISLKDTVQETYRMEEVDFLPH